MRLGFLSKTLHYCFLSSLFTSITKSTPYDFCHSYRPRFYTSKPSKNEYSIINFPKFSSDSTERWVLEAIHTKMIKCGCSQSLPVANRILNLYLKSRKFGDAQKLFDEILIRNVRTWTTLIAGFASVGLFSMAVSVFRRMQMEGVCPNQQTFSTILKCFSTINGLRNGKAIHGWLLLNEIALDNVMENSLLHFYLKCGAMNCMRKFFITMDEKDTISWNIMINALLKIGDLSESLELFRRLPSKDVTCWNSIISGLMQNGFEQTALDLLSQMVFIGPPFNGRTFFIALVLASSLSILELGRQIHSRLLRLVILDDLLIRELINMYCKCREMAVASIVFEKMAQTNNPFASFSSIVSGYVHIDKWEEALKFFSNLVRERIMVDPFTLTSLVSGCADAGVLEVAQLIHAHIEKSGHKFDIVLSSSMINMYAKCGTLDDAKFLFGNIKDRNVITWTIMIMACAFHGRGNEAITHFNAMLNQRIYPNEITFVAILTACSHSGLIEEGKKCFSLMKDVYQIAPGVEHFTCMVDLLGRGGCLDDAKNFILENNILHLSSVWSALLSSCRIHKNFEMGKWASRKLVQLEPSKRGPHIWLSNMCEDSIIMNRKWVRKLRGKQPGRSWIRMGNRVHYFVMGDRSHSQSDEILSYLKKLSGRVKEEGYLSDVREVFQDVEEEQKQELVGVHSEKLAIAFAAMNTDGGGKTPIRVTKNLRICNDCHNFMKYASRVLDREIIVRDICRFHHFKSACCSCGDFW